MKHCCHWLSEYCRYPIQYFKREGGTILVGFNHLRSVAHCRYLDTRKLHYLTQGSFEYEVNHQVAATFPLHYA